MTAPGYLSGSDPTPAQWPRPAEAEDELYEMANLYPRSTGLPMTVWVSPRGNAQHDARVKVSEVRGDRMSIERSAVVGIRPKPALLQGELAAADLESVIRWIELNREVLLDYWNGEADTTDLVTRLQRV